jgi:hypothetical protein
MPNKNLTVVNTQDTKVALIRAKNLMGVANKLLAKSRAKELEAIKSKELANPLVWTDPDTNLTWQVDIDERDFTRDEAFDYAKELNKQNYGGYNDWKVPTINELRTLGNIKLYNFYDESLNDFDSYQYWKKENWDKGYDNPKKRSGKTFIKKPLLNSMNMRYQWFWSSTTNASNTSGAWVVDFNDGHEYWNFKTDSKYVRCVRLTGQ